MSLVNKKINDTLLLISAISCTFIGHINLWTSCSVLFWTQNILCLYYLSITLLFKCVLGNILIFLSPIHNFKGNLARHYILWSALVFPEMLPSVVWDLLKLFSTGLKSQIFGDICMRLYFFSQVVLFLYFFYSDIPQKLGAWKSHSSPVTGPVYSWEVPKHFWCAQYCSEGVTT